MKKTTDTMNILERNKAFRAWSNTEECKEKALSMDILSTNSKLDKSNTSDIIYVGIEFPSAYQNSCFPQDCEPTCIFASGVGNMLNNKKASSFVTAMDKTKLARWYLYKKQRAYFDIKLTAELKQLEIKAEILNKTVVVRTGVFSEIDELFDWVAINFPSFQISDYVKQISRITRAYEENQQVIYSWNPQSTEQQLIDCLDYQRPIATVIPKKMFNKLFGLKEKALDFYEDNNVIYVNGDKSDLECFQHLGQGKLVISLLSKKQTRKGEETNKFLESYSSLLNLLG